MAEFGEWRIDDVESVSDPLRLAMTDQHDLHGEDGTLTGRV
jgi:hypothetical protein